MAPLPADVVRAAGAFGLDAGSLQALGGASGTTFSDGQVILRVGERVADEILATSAAAAAVPVPRVLDRIELDGRTAALLERVTGRTAGDLALTTPERAAAVGRACGALHDLLSGVPAPPGLREQSQGGRLLHLDLHPYNVLVDDGGEVTAVIDWANAAAGDPQLDAARTWSILTLDPAAIALQAKPGWAALTESWLDAGRLRELPAAARAWACGFMLEDLAGRHPPEALTHVRRAGRASA
jgi:Ser/Thr protein kinase RdoA (MazF antagonist)